ncbi:four helix bundle protein [Alkalibacillus haloalkaliphilus]|uniref:four helix bundle protein n=1 Tax=Alkalibacillus haloalkaliphilus TaxID=94136 RepID=UPI002935E405|nr:four helix bundle protein [Alkalibacillus haloalkaliphilus]MDV2581677.1 four helix bundle protein [Alkalibacillus haloalkaliphilus]
MPKLKDLKAYQKSLEYSLKVRDLVKDFPDFEREILSDQLLRSSLSVVSNISEGYYQESPKNYLKHLNIAVCSLAESQSQLELATISGLIDLSTHREMDALADQIHRMCYGLKVHITNKSKKLEKVL